MPRFILALFILLFFVKVNYAQVSPDAILGEWYSPEKDGKFLFYKSGNYYCGKLIWIEAPNDEYGNPKKDINNPDKSKQNQLLLELVIFKDFVWDNDDEEWDDGSVYDPTTGYTWSCTISMVDSKVLKVRGYLGFNFIGRSEYFTKY